MSGTKAGGIKAAATNIEKYGRDFYKKNGKKGGQNGHTGGFYVNPELARIAGAKGGRKSRRTGVRNGEGHTKYRYRKKPAKAQDEPARVFKKVGEYENVKPEKKGISSRIFGRGNG